MPDPVTAITKLNLFPNQPTKLLKMGIVQRHSISVTIISYVGIVIGYFNKIILFTNFLNTEEVGLANLLVTISLIYAQVAALGTFNIAYRFFPFFQNKETNDNGFLPGLSFIASAGFTLTTIIFILFKPVLSEYYAESSPLLVEYLYYIVPMAFSNLFFQLFDAYLRCHFKNSFPSLVYDVLLRLLITFSITVYALNWISFPAFILVYTIANFLPVVIIVFYTWSQGLLSFRLNFSTTWKRLYRIAIVYGLYSMVNNLSFLLISTIDALMIARMINLGSAGIYTTAVFVTSVLLIPYRSVIKVTTPLVATFLKNKDFRKLNELYHKVSDSNLVIGGGMFLLLWVNIQNIFSFMPGEYAAGIYCFLMLASARLWDMTAAINGTILLNSRKYRYDLLFTLGLLVVTIATNYLLIPLYGINGAALASMLSIIIYNLVKIIFVRYHFGMHPFSFRQMWVPFLLLVLSFVSMQSGSFTNVYFDLIVRSLVIGLLYVMVVYVLKISEETNQVIRQYLAVGLKFLGFGSK